MGRHQRRVHRRDGPRSSTTGTLPPQGAQAAAPGEADRRAGGRRARQQTMYALYDPPSPAGPHRRPGPARRGATPVVDVRRPDRPDRGHHRANENPRTAGRFDQLPFALTPGPPIPTGSCASPSTPRPPTSRPGCPTCPPSAVIDILLRRTPRTRSGAPLPAYRRRPTSTSPPRCSTSTRRTSRCTGRPAPARPSPRPRSSRAGQRTPLAHRRRRAVARRRGEPVPRRDRGRRRPGAGGQEGARRRTPRGRRSTKDDYAGFIADERRLRRRRHRMGFRQRSPGAARQPRPARHRGGRPVQPGQHHRGGAVPPRNLLLLGDPQQLPQVSQGTHPEPVDTSALGWLIDGRHTLPAELGYFLDRSYRMHPDGVRGGVAAVLRRPAALGRRADRGAHARRARAGRAGAHRRPRRQLDRQPRGGRRDRRRDRSG